jgi:hypothetical protein
VSSTTALRGRSGSVLAAGLIGIGLTVFVQQVTGINGGSIFLLALGAGFFVAYFNQRHHTSNLLIPASLFTGLGLGVSLVSGNVTPEYLHGALMCGTLALAFGAIYLIGDAARHRWALYPAAGLALIAWLNFVTQAPWLKDTFGAITHVMWPLLLVGAGLWLIERGRRQPNLD